MSHRSVLIVSVAILSLVSFGCRDTSLLGVITISDRDGETPSIPVIRMEPASEESPSHATVSLDNAGDRAVSISRIVYSHPEVFSIYSSHIPGQIEPGERALIEISFHPNSVLPHESVVSIYLDGRATPVEFKVSAQK